jgi:hypothetical protein
MNTKKPLVTLLNCIVNEIEAEAKEQAPYRTGKLREDIRSFGGDPVRLGVEHWVF